MKKLEVFLLLLSTCFCFSVDAQDVHFSQYQFAPLVVNPALAGNGQDIGVHMNYKSQWKNIGAGYETLSGSFDTKIPSSNSGNWVGGVLFYTDKAGDAELQTMHASANVGYVVPLNNKSSLSGAIMAGFAQQSVTQDNLKWGSQYSGLAFDPSLSHGESLSSNTNSFLDLGAGIVYSYAKNQRNMTSNDQLSFDVGLSLFHLHRPNYSFMPGAEEQLARKLAFFARGTIGNESSNISFLPEMYFFHQNTSQEIIAGGYIKYRLKESSKMTGFYSSASFSLGAFYRHWDAAIIAIMFEKANYSIGATYDINISKLSNVTNGSGGFEIALRYRMLRK